MIARAIAVAVAVMTRVGFGLADGCCGQQFMVNEFIPFVPEWCDASDAQALFAQHDDLLEDGLGGGCPGAPQHSLSVPDCSSNCDSCAWHDIDSHASYPYRLSSSAVLL